MGRIHDSRPKHQKIRTQLLSQHQGCRQIRDNREAVWSQALNGLWCREQQQGIQVGALQQSHYRQTDVFCAADARIP